MSTNNFQPEKKASDRDSLRGILKSTSKMSVGTLFSRILGYVRDVILAYLFGTGMKADVFFVAFRIPNLFRDFVGEGATNSAVVPVFAQYFEKEQRDDFWKLVSVVFTAALIGLSLITIVGMICAPVIIRIIAPGFMADPVKFDLAVMLTRMMFPYLIFIGLTAYSMGTLFTFRSFSIPAFTPCLLNIALIISAWLASQTMAEPIFGLAIGVLIGGILQFVTQLWALKRIGFSFSLPKSLMHPGAIKIGKLMMPRMLGSGVYQLSILADTFCASLTAIVGLGGISAIYYANRIIQLPMGLFSVALASAVLPSLSSFAAKNDTDSIKKTLIFSLENIFVIMCPITVMLMFFSTPIIQVLFERGEFNAYSTSVTAWALVGYSMGLFSFGAVKILVSAFHAMQDTKTPVKIAVVCLIVNITLNFILMYPFKIAGIALASAIASTLNFGILFMLMNKRIGSMNTDLIAFIVRVLIASIVAGCLAWGIWLALPGLGIFLKLIIVSVVVSLVYLGIGLMLKIAQIQKVWSWIFKKS